MRGAGPVTKPPDAPRNFDNVPTRRASTSPRSGARAEYSVCFVDHEKSIVTLA